MKSYGLTIKAILWNQHWVMCINHTHYHNYAHLITHKIAIGTTWNSRPCALYWYRNRVEKYRFYLITKLIVPSAFICRKAVGLHLSRKLSKSRQQKQKQSQNRWKSLIIYWKIPVFSTKRFKHTVSREIIIKTRINFVSFLDICKKIHDLQIKLIWNKPRVSQLSS